MAVDTSYLAGGLESALEKPTMNYRRFVALYIAVGTTIGGAEQTAWLAELTAKFGPESDTPSGFRKMPFSMQERMLVYGRCKLLELRYIDNVGPLPVYAASPLLLTYNNAGDSFRLHPQKMIDAIAYACELLDIVSRGLLLGDWTTLVRDSLQMPDTATKLLNSWDPRLAATLIAMARVFGSPYQTVAGLGDYELDITPETPKRLRDPDYTAFIQFTSWLAEGAFWGAISFTDPMDILSQEDYGTTSMDALVAEMVDLFRRGRVGINDMRRYMPQAEIVAYGYTPEIVVQLLDYLVADMPKLPAQDNIVWIEFTGGKVPNAATVTATLKMRVPAGIDIEQLLFAIEYPEGPAGELLGLANGVSGDADTFVATDILLVGNRCLKIAATKAAKWAGGGEYTLGTFDILIPAGKKYGSPPVVTVVPNNAVFIASDGATPHASAMEQLGMRFKTGIKTDQSQNLAFPVQAPLFPIPPL